MKGRIIFKVVGNQAIYEGVVLELFAEHVLVELWVGPEKKPDEIILVPLDKIACEGIDGDHWYFGAKV